MGGSAALANPTFVKYYRLGPLTKGGLQIGWLTLEA